MVMFKLHLSLSKIFSIGKVNISSIFGEGFFF